MADRVRSRGEISRLLDRNCTEGRKESPVSRGATRARHRRLFDQLDAEFDRRPALSLTEAARRVGVHCHTAAQAILGVTGLCPRRWRAQRLRERARRLLTPKGAASIKAAAIELGCCAVSAARLGKEAQRFLSLLTSADSAQAPVIVDTEITSEDLYHAPDPPPAIAVDTLLVVVESGCPPCDEAIGVWERITTDAVGRGDLRILVAAMHPMEPGTRRGRAVLLVREPDEYRARTGITTVPTALLAREDRHVLAVVIGVPQVEAIRQVLHLAGRPVGPFEPAAIHRGGAAQRMGSAGRALGEAALFVDRAGR